MNLTKTALRTLALAGLGLLGFVPASRAQHWSLTSAPNTNWTCLASSMDGSRVIAGTGSGGLFLSTNSGVTWSESAAPENGWSDVASSADGSMLIGLGGGGIYVSHDAGANWIATGQGGNSLACSSDGQKIFVTEWFGVIRRSLDYGTNWSDTHSPNPGWASIACSADGTQVLAVCENNGQVFHSTNSGLDWDTTVLPASNWQKTLSSADGNRLIAAGSDPTWGTGQIYASTNSGASWDLISATSPASGNNWGGIASSADGHVLAAAKTGAYGYPGGSIFVSWNTGDFWNLTDAPFVDWNDIISSGDGAHLLAATSGGIYALNIGTCTTLPARGTNGTALFQAVLNPNGSDTTAWFEWGETPAHGNTTTPQLIGNGGIGMFADLVTNLDIGKDYYFRVVATNASGLTVGEDQIYHAPVIELVNGNNLTLDFDGYFTDPGAFVTNENDAISVTGSVDTGTPGVYVLTYSTTNALGIAGATNRTVTVLGPQAIFADVLTNVVALRATLPNAQARLLDPVITALNRATSPNVWVDEVDLDPAKGEAVFTTSQKALSALTTLTRRGGISPVTAQQWTSRLLQSIRLLAYNEINTALQAGAQQHQLVGAAKQFAMGDDAWNREKFTLATSHYHAGWKQASKLLKKLKR